MNDPVVTKQDVQDIVIRAIQDLVIPRFDEIEERFNTLEQRFDAVERRLTQIESDVQDLRADMRLVKSSLSRLDALEADIKELYVMVAAGRSQAKAGKKFEQLPFERKILELYDAFQLLAKEAGVTLPH